MNILDAIGNTSIVRLRGAAAGGAELFAKLEWENPTGSMKDRMARAVIERAENDGRLKPGYTVVEYTGGSTGTSLAFVCAAKGYRIRIVTSDAFSQEKRNHMKALGAALTLVPSEGGLTTKQLILDMIEAARAIAAGPHKIEGVGIGYLPPLWDPAAVDEIVAVSTAEAKEMARRLARENGLFAGTSSGANVVAAIGVAERTGRGARIATLMCESGLKDLSTDVYGA